MKGGEFLNYLNDYYPLKKGCASCSQLGECLKLPYTHFCVHLLNSFIKIESSCNKLHFYIGA